MNGPICQWLASGWEGTVQQHQAIRPLRQHGGGEGCIRFKGLFRRRVLGSFSSHKLKISQSCYFSLTCNIEQGFILCLELKSSQETDRSESGFLQVGNFLGEKQHQVARRIVLHYPWCPRLAHLSWVWLISWVRRVELLQNVRMQSFNGHCSTLAFLQILITLLEKHKCALQETKVFTSRTHQVGVLSSATGPCPPGLLLWFTQPRSRESIQLSAPTPLHLSCVCALSCSFFPYQSSLALKIDQCIYWGLLFLFPRTSLSVYIGVYPPCLAWCLKCRCDLATCFGQRPDHTLGQHFVLKIYHYRRRM